VIKVLVNLPIGGTGWAEILTHDEDGCVLGGISRVIPSPAGLKPAVASVLEKLKRSGEYRDPVEVYVSGSLARDRKIGIPGERRVQRQDHFPGRLEVA
jgi:hypothetical protein